LADFVTNNTEVTFATNAQEETVIGIKANAC